MMAYLFPLALRGSNSDEVEAISSFIYRLAITHGVSAWKLFERAGSWYSAAVPTAAHTLELLRNSPDIAILVRPNNLSQTVVDMLTHVTGNQNLRSGTFLSLRHALDRSVATFAKTLRWCRACMREFVAAGDPGYFKLVWHLASVTHCPTHRTPLVDRCSNCGSVQRGVGSRKDCTSCFGCGQALADGPTQERWSSWNHGGGDLVQLVRAIGTDPQLAFPQNGVREVVARIFDNVWNREQELQFWSVIPRDECLGIIDGQIPVTLLTARRLAFRLGIPLVDLLSGTVANSAAGILSPEWTASLPSDMRPKKRVTRRNRSAVIDRLEDILRSQRAEKPISLKELANKLSISVGFLHYHFPQRARDVIQRHAEWRLEERQRKVREARAAALAFFTNDRYMNEPKSRKHALRVLRQETGLPKNLLRQEIGTALQVLGYDRS